MRFRSNKLQRSPGLRKPLLVDIRDRQPRTASRQFERQRTPDPGARSGDHRDFARERGQAAVPASGTSTSGTGNTMPVPEK